MESGGRAFQTVGRQEATGSFFQAQLEATQGLELGWGMGCDLIYFFKHHPGRLLEEGGGRPERKLEPRHEVLRGRAVSDAPP